MTTHQIHTMSAADWREIRDQLARLTETDGTPVPSFGAMAANYPMAGPVRSIARRIARSLAGMTISPSADQLRCMWNVLDHDGPVILTDDQTRRLQTILGSAIDAALAGQDEPQPQPKPEPAPGLPLEPAAQADPAAPAAPVPEMPVLPVIDSSDLAKLDAIAATIGATSKPSEIAQALTSALAIAEYWRAAHDNKKGGAPVPPPNRGERRHPVFAKVFRAIQAGLNVMLVGPAGCGKTTLAQQVAQALGLDFYASGAVASEYKLTGFISAHNEYKTTAFRAAFEHGGLFLFDEMDASAPAALLAFNAALANDWQEFPDSPQPIRRHEKFICIAAVNTWGRGASRDYVGRAQLDAATLDRFTMIEVDYDQELELALGASNRWTKHVQAVRAACLDLKIRLVVSTRAVISGGKLLAAGEDWPAVEDACLWRGLDMDSRAKIAAHPAVRAAA